MPEALLVPVLAAWAMLIIFVGSYLLFLLIVNWKMYHWVAFLWFLMVGLIYMVLRGYIWA